MSTNGLRKIILAVFTTANLVAMCFTLTEGMKCAWWNRALQVTTLSQLHDTWTHDTSLIAATRGVRH